jgi:YidC/Oxa1 family membrane protein insertase
MDTQRLILFFVFVFSTFMLVDGWQRDQREQQGKASVTQAATAKAAAKADGKSDTSGVPVPQAPAVDVPAAPAAAAPAGAGSVPAAAVSTGGEIVRVETDVLLVQINTKGGDINRLEFKQHKGTLDKTKNFVLFQNTADNKYFAQSGLTGGLPNHHTVYQVSSREYKLAEGAQVLEVRLEAPELRDRREL